MKSTKREEIPQRIFAQASPRSVGGVSIFAAQYQIDQHAVANFFSDEDVVSRAVYRLQDAGFEILQVSPLSINLAGPAELYEKAFSTKIIAEERPVIKTEGREDTATFLDSPDTELSGLISTTGTSFEELIEGVAIEEPRYFMAPSMFAPLKSYWHLRIPGDVSLADNADRAHRAGITGKGIKVAMIDSGWYKHPYFVGRGYNAAPVVLAPGAANPLDDEVGHGTGESANIFSLAPDISFFPVKMSFVNTTAAFNTAVGLGPDIITCSWGSSNRYGPLSASDQALAAAIAAAVATGITVVFSAGNGHWGFPGQHPDVIAAGGVFMNPDESLQASDYASGFMSNIYTGRRVPDLCGLVGMQPRAIYIMLPVQPKDDIDVGNAGSTQPNGDETATDDGWGAFSGTSAAAPQLAGAAALVKQACPRLTPAEIKAVLMKSARDVTTGNCNPSTGGNPASVGPDLATGNGLVDAHKAVMLAKVRCLGPVVPPGRTLPPTPGPVHPAPRTPAPRTPPPRTPAPRLPGPIPPEPVGPVRPEPIKPTAPINPAPISKPEPATAPAAAPALTEDDVRALEEMIVKSEIDI